MRDELMVENMTEETYACEETRPRLCRKKDSEDGTTWAKKKRTTKAEMDGLYKRHDRYQDDLT